MLAVKAWPAFSLFIGQYSWCRAIDEFHEEIMLDPGPDAFKDNGEDGPLVRLEISRSGEIFTEKEENGQTADTFGIADNFTGYAANENQRYSVSYTPLNNIATLPVVLNKEMEFRKNYAQEPILKVRTYFTLLEVLDAIYDDISFAGGPQEKVEFLGMLKSRMEDAEQHPERLKPWRSLEEAEDLENK